MKSRKAKAKGAKPKAGNRLSPFASRHASLVLAGFIGTGKTSLGRLVAERLGREFVDMDSVIEEREGKSVQEIFAQRGEGHFRAIESALCAELALRENLVIATGGALLDAVNRRRSANAFVVCFDASLDEVLRRLNGSADRPLLADGDVLKRVEELMLARQKAYSQIERHIDTTGLSEQAIARQVISTYREAVT